MLFRSHYCFQLQELTGVCWQTFTVNNVVVSQMPVIRALVPKGIASIQTNKTVSVSVEGRVFFGKS